MAVTKKTIYQVNGKVFTSYEEADAYDKNLALLAQIGSNKLVLGQTYYITGFNLWNFFDHFNGVPEEYQERGIIKLCLDVIEIEDNFKKFIFSELHTGRLFTVKYNTERSVDNLCLVLRRTVQELFEFDQDEFQW